jgi:hypothetical protein
MSSVYDDREIAALDEAVVEVNRFLLKAQALKDQLLVGVDTYQLPERAAAQRASLDLTMSLAQFRKARTT